MQASRLEHLLDTGIANRVALQDPVTLGRLANASFAYLPTIVLGELYFGAYVYAHRHHNSKFLEMYDALLVRFRHQLVTCDDETAQVYGAISAELKVTGRPMQQNDMWIAALARQHMLTVATHDRDCLRVARLAVELFLVSRIARQFLIPGASGLHQMSKHNSRTGAWPGGSGQDRVWTWCGQHDAQHRSIRGGNTASGRTVTLVVTLVVTHPRYTASIDRAGGDRRRQTETPRAIWVGEGSHARISGADAERAPVSGACG